MVPAASYVAGLCICTGRSRSRFLSWLGDTVLSEEEKMSGAVNEIISSQAGWAKRHGIAFDTSHVCRTVDDNLFMPLDPESAAEFGRGPEMN